MTKECAACKHVRYDRYWPKCQRTAKMRYNKSGEYVDIEYCEDEREHVPFFFRWLVRTCGPDGKYWEAAEKFDPKAR